MNAKEKKFADKNYEIIEENTEEYDDGFGFSYAGADDVAYYILDIVITHDSEDEGDFCSAEFLKVKKSDLDYNSYQKAKKEFDRMIKEAEDEGEDLNDVALDFPEFSKDEWEDLTGLEKFYTLEDFLDYGDVDLMIDEENIDMFVSKLKEMGIIIPEEYLEDLK